MPFTLTMPKLSPTMESGTIIKWNKHVGDKVNAGDVLFEVATDKATVEHTAIDEGWLRVILVEEGQEAQVNQPVAIFTEGKEEKFENYQPEGVSPKKQEVLPAEKEEPAKQEVSPKKSPEFVIGAQPSFTPATPLEEYEFEFPTQMNENRVKASPLARKIAKDKNLDVSSVIGSGPGGRIVSRDLDKALSLGKGIGRRDIPQIKPGTYTEEALTPMRKIIAKRLQESKSFIPHFYVNQIIDAKALVEMREQLSKMGMKLSYNDFVVRACALSLRKYPKINSGFNSLNNKIIHFKTIDISIAVTLESGLITPIVRHADYKSIGELSVEVKSLAKRAREGKLAENEYKGGSFTISNMGMFGVTDFQAIINPPQAAILAVSGIQEAPVVRNGQIEAGKIMNLTLSVDHRVIDGVAAAEFIQGVKKYLENPAILLI